MLLICNDLSTQDPTIKEAVKNKDAKAILEIAQEAKKIGFDYLELDATNLEDEAEGLQFLLDSIQETDLKFILRIKNNSVYDKVLPNLKRAGIIAPQRLSDKDALEVFSILKELDEGWGVLFTQTFGDDTVSTEVEGLHKLISKAEQEGIMPERQFMEPIGEPLIKNNRSFAKMKRMVDAFSNSYPSINFYVNLPLAAQGLDDEVTLMNVFVGMADLIGVNAFSFSTKHKAHLKAIKAADALLDSDGDLESYLKAD